MLRRECSTSSVYAVGGVSCLVVDDSQSVKFQRFSLSPFSLQVPCSSPTTLWLCACWAAPLPPWPAPLPPCRPSSWPRAPPLRPALGRVSRRCSLRNTKLCQTATEPPTRLQPPKRNVPALSSRLSCAGSSISANSGLESGQSRTSVLYFWMEVIPGGVTKCVM